MGSYSAYSKESRAPITPTRVHTCRAVLSTLWRVAFCCWFPFITRAGSSGDWHSTWKSHCFAKINSNIEQMNVCFLWGGGDDNNKKKNNIHEMRKAHFILDDPEGYVAFTVSGMAYENKEMLMFSSAYYWICERSCYF